MSQDPKDCTSTAYYQCCMQRCKLLWQRVWNSPNKWSCAARPYLACSKELSASYCVTDPLLQACKNAFLLYRCREASCILPLTPRIDIGLAATWPQCNRREISINCRGKRLSEKHLSQTGTHSAALCTTAFAQKYSLDTSVDTARQKHSVVWYAVTIKVGCNRYIGKI